MDVEDQIKEDMASLGCTSRQKITLAYLLYIYLIDTKLMYDTEYDYNKDLDTFYIKARPSKNRKVNIYVPFSTIEDVSIERIEILQKTLCSEETGNAINLAFIEGDTNTVVYTLSKGLADLQTPDGLSTRKTREERRNNIDVELKRNKEKILQEALKRIEEIEDKEPMVTE